MNRQTANTSATPVIDTPRLRLRPFREDDLDRLFECARNPILGDSAGWKPHETREESDAILHEVFLDKETVWAIELRENGMFIGTVGLIPDPMRANTGLRMIGYWLDQSCWGRARPCFPHAANGRRHGHVLSRQRPFPRFAATAGIRPRRHSAHGRQGPPWSAARPADVHPHARRFYAMQSIIR